MDCFSLSGCLAIRLLIVSRESLLLKALGLPNPTREFRHDKPYYCAYDSSGAALS